MGVDLHFRKIQSSFRAEGWVREGKLAGKVARAGMGRGTDEEVSPGGTGVATPSNIHSIELFP